ncbi:MAG: cytochrome c [Acidimicrobiia bacterium]|nr:cytochrome c [Acidimicrobiia bacterium]
MASQTCRSTTDQVRPRRRRVAASAFAVVTSLTVAAILTACSGEVPEVSSDDAVLVLGREVYSRNCVGCHGAEGQGGTGSKLNEGTVVANYPDPADQFAVIANGKNQMPAYTGRLSDDEIEAVVRFTREGL